MKRPLPVSRIHTVPEISNLTDEQIRGLIKRLQYVLEQRESHRQ